MSVCVGVVTHERRDEAREEALFARDRLVAAGADAFWVGDQPDRLADAELLLVIGGDGTILRAAELARPYETPILGINFGHVGFLAEEDPEAFDLVVQSVVERRWTVNSRLTIDVTVTFPDGSTASNWALNEASVEKGPHMRMIEADIGVDRRGLSSFKADAVLLSTPTGSTAYNFSAGGPIVWPDVEALLLTPIAAHALFARPLVVSKESTLEVYIRSDNAVVWFDGRRNVEAPEGSLITAVKGRHPVKLARLNDSPFSGRLVRKFHLPVEGWRRPKGEA
ncbi:MULTISPECIES: NAD kinase [Trueperella]|uniref:NAD kinase n=1 Tax=Trueperella abortisuis TaxID=445930 RepID=A0ABT9PIF6_9ACTO|nr:MULTISPECIES: NAD kinase [Trueperella]MCI7306050.1 NAD kinase [Trueperella sp.]MDP9832498.1 NAD+ kinase [Trueperella abortisuis]MDY5403497.1 NAD kinase [Trueperella sp.]